MKTARYHQSLKAIIISYIAYRWIFIILTYGIIVVYDFLKFRKSELVLESKYISVTTGLFSVQTMRISYQNIANVSYTQSVIGRNTNSGVVVITLSGAPELKLKFFEKPHTITEAIRQQMPYREDASRADKDWKAIVIGKVNDATLKEVEANCIAGEQPKYVIGDGINGSLAIFEDRCLVIKKGLGTSFMSGRLGGGMSATFDYLDITGIEYNTGMLTGVLEILTASYSGRETNSPWDFKSDRGAHASSNMLPWDKIFYKKVRPQIEEMKQLIRAAKRR